MCGRETICTVANHIPLCDCLPGYTGNAYVACAKIESMKKIFKFSNIKSQKNIVINNFRKKSHFLGPQIYYDTVDHCNPSPCGQNSHCKSVNSQAVCSCLPGYYGAPPACRSECAINSDCINTRACVNERCIDPCPGSCAPNAECRVVNHKALCYCLPRYTGDPFVRCAPIAIGKGLIKLSVYSIRIPFSNTKFNVLFCIFHHINPLKQNF